MCDMRYHFVYFEHSANNISGQVMWHEFVRSEVHSMCITYQITYFRGSQAYCTWVSVLCINVIGVTNLVLRVMQDKCGVHPMPVLKKLRKYCSDTEITAF